MNVANDTSQTTSKYSAVSCQLSAVSRQWSVVSGQPLAFACSRSLGVALIADS
ncbi:hypothetical protein [Moorena sp. SIO4G3]|uniref:hypothetical protein n=1 Tax=Moorena sp. SIO4G3 TaxID=2607821 RepID=UPI0014299DD2|nr:hypothetical protein [Moorena sp. SIO4G3]NEO76441.1 hypothetical protein [Moorena sp. SIO4G3]